MRINKMDMLGKLWVKFPIIRDITVYREFPTGRRGLYVGIKEDRLNNSDYMYFFPDGDYDIYSDEMLKQVLKEFKTKYRENVKQYKEWLKTPKGKDKIFREKIENFALTAARRADEHGAYHTSDRMDVTILDYVTGKAKRKYFATGEFLALVRINRERTYSKAYTRNFGTGKRKDTFLIGINETGSTFAHQVSDKITTIEDAEKWIWNNNEITARHGDIAITPAKVVIKKPGDHVENEQLIDAHMFTGEIKRNGAIYVRNGVLHHDKQQHPDITIPDKWYKIVFAKRYHKIGARGGTVD